MTETRRLPFATTSQVGMTREAADVSRADIDQQRLAEIERHLAEATPGRHERDCGGRIIATIDGEPTIIGEAYAEGDARLWRHAYADIRYLLAELRRLYGEDERADTIREQNRQEPL